MVCEEEHHAGDSVDESHSTGTEMEARVGCLRSRLLHTYVYRSFVYSRKAQGCHRGAKKWVSKCETKGEKLWARTERVSVPLVQTDPVNPAEKTACRDRHMDTKAKSKRKE